MNNNETNTKNRIEIITAELANCQWRLEQAIRADERKTATKQWRQYARDLAASEVKKANEAAAKKAAEDHQAWQEKLVRLFEDRNGEGSKTDPQRRGVGQRGKDSRVFRDGSKLQALYRALQRRNYPVTRVTLQRESGLEGWSFYEGIRKLRQRGYSIETLRTGRPKPKYQLAS